MHYRINAPQVISETIGHETIVVNLSTGSYYSLEGSAVDIWEAIQRGDSLPTIVAHLEAHYVGAPGELDAATRRLVAELEREDVIVPISGEQPSVDDRAAPPSLNGSRAPFVSPGLHKFTDMQDIIMLDPVHEVDERGWPHATPESGTSSSQ